MGTVFLAHDTRLGRRVAIKFLTEERTAHAKQFYTEARAIARCKHENIVVVYDMGEFEDQAYMVLEYVAGTTLRTWLNERWPFDLNPESDGLLDETWPSERAKVPRILSLESL